ncbi:MAG TPA: AAA family ATPase, partial [Methanocorpusculum sp.]|nr:AAA family ATPase [Methanocorpusculum sp.]
MRITISGSPGTGTTSLGKAIADKYNLKYHSAGESFRQMAINYKMDLKSFCNFAKNNQEIDRKIDENLKEIGESTDNIVIEGRLAGWMVKNADLKISLYASPECRAIRISNRENQSVDDAYTSIIEREKNESSRYMEFYNINITDTSPYDISINTEKFNLDDVISIC